MEKRLIICITGHRPKSLPWGYDENLESCCRFKETMRAILRNAILNGYRYFICGMAIGIDMICAEIILELKTEFSNIVLECAIPCIGQESRWNIDQQKRYYKILNEADNVHYVSNQNYFDGCMNDRNRYMVEKSDVVIAVWNGKPSGTSNTFKMAKELDKKIRIINPYRLI